MQRRGGAAAEGPPVLPLADLGVNPAPGEELLGRLAEDRGEGAEGGQDDLPRPVEGAGRQGPAHRGILVVKGQAGQAEEAGFQGEVVLGDAVVRLRHLEHPLHGLVVNLVAQVALRHGVGESAEAVQGQMVLDDGLVQGAQHQVMSREDVEKCFVGPPPDVPLVSTIPVITVSVPSDSIATGLRTTNR